ncbi:ABC-2 type transport system permease protein [Clostridium cavendishii DSM 21758]|uniref:ABC-2 type transport system permease protein n=1 Tax=Clostridium cavendishii DSM 21758 TaxID=1121302 RepID=A0A1M6CBN7_9CLOT|nr:ABC transporter permease subunit [Clostridium cavendishii]SHI58231.1 ABC-2 type transport system permease protein [Clostridium cavendishii DSM 21758]
MKSYIAFTKKELIEQVRTYKLFIFLAVLFVFGMVSPLFAKIMPDIISSMNTQGVEIKIPKPTYIDAYAQFLKNIGQMGIFALLLIFSGLLSNDVTKGTLVNMVSKGLSRRVIILAKLSSAVLIWTLGYLIAIATNYIYTFYLFGEHSVNNLVLALFSLWLFGVFLISIIILGSTIVKGSYGGLILTAIIYGSLALINLFPKIIKFNPYTLTSKNMDLITDKMEIRDIKVTIITTVVLIVIALVASLKIFERNKL